MTKDRFLHGFTADPKPGKGRSLRRRLSECDRAVMAGFTRGGTSVEIGEDGSVHIVVKGREVVRIDEEGMFVNGVKVG